MPLFLFPRRAVLALAVVCLGAAFTVTSVQAEDLDTSRWIIEADEARALLGAGALLLDTRG
jgi:thiosulfate/3-mercaptopyruvate sulfurtransferase